MGGQRCAGPNLCPSRGRDRCVWSVSTYELINWHVKFYVAGLKSRNSIGCRGPLPRDAVFSSRGVWSRKKGWQKFPVRCKFLNRRGTRMTSIFCKLFTYLRRLMGPFTNLSCGSNPLWTLASRRGGHSTQQALRFQTSCHFVVLFYVVSWACPHQAHRSLQGLAQKIYEHIFSASDELARALSSSSRYLPWYLIPWC